MFERNLYKDVQLNVAARFINRRIFLNLGGFDENLIAGEDYDFQKRLNNLKYKTRFINSEELHIGEPKYLKEIIHKHYFYGRNIGL